MPDMAKNMQKLTLGWRISRDVKDDFTDFCAKVGSLVQEDCSGALVIWPYLPAQIREWARLEAKGLPAVDKKFWIDFQKGLELGLAAQANIQQKKPVKERK